MRLHLRSEIRALQRRLGVTTIMVTHDQEEALSVSDRLVVMSKGRIEQVGVPEEVYRAPRSAFVANFIGRSSAFDAIVRPGGLIEAKGVQLAASAAQAMQQGIAVRVLIRPEDVEIGAGVHGPQAQITSVEYLGPVCQVELALGSLPLTADILSDRVQQDGIAEGGSVSVSIAPDRVMVFPADD